MNALICPLKRHRMSRWIKKQTYFTERLASLSKGTNRPNIEGTEKIFHAGGSQESVGAAVLPPGKVDL